MLEDTREFISPQFLPGKDFVEMAHVLNDLKIQETFYKSWGFLPFD